ncbi:CTP synthase [Candidatus Kaiserbacteria bacterium RIFCSPHIGHO2_02_FULL_49_34]|uniref:CTP synthase n=1 Tax=Candidatus Kaiserbacteria bacterium RIFCSPHIGHO2_02_FULL_49_34 TaxID=1798491 RepID=A0A1F6DIF6_9BACT|nr:MAG: CTP synthase [Candidatus Kaiserbacteria bacterium RIFCSPHIGHO2_02_FULL_49_34]
MDKKEIRFKRAQNKTRNYIFVVGGVMSGVGKGITASSIAQILQARGLSVTAMKIDPYINVDAGTMNPTEHGEVFVLGDGLETDQDMGNYERFLNIDIPGINYMTTGSVYRDVIEKERSGGYKGRNVEVVPDIPLEVISRFEKAAEAADADVVIVEIGGTVGEYQGVLFLEAIRMMKARAPEHVAVVMVSYLPVPGSVGEMKTKPTQTAVRALNSAGVFADFIVARGPLPLDEKRKDKIAQFCNVKREHIISAPDVASVYDVPLNFEKDNFSKHLCEVLHLPCTKESDISAWGRFVQKTKKPKHAVTIAVVGKYFSSGDFILSDVYLSVLEAIKYSAYSLNAKPIIRYFSSLDFEKDPKKLNVLSEVDGILVPGGFGTTGIDGILATITYARTKKIPYFGICYGMQLAVIEYARNVLKMKDAHTVEINPKTPFPLIDVMETQRDNVKTQNLGGTMRLGEYPAHLKKGTIAAAAYKKTEISERHRHRYEVNNTYVERITEGGVIFSGASPTGDLMEILELPKTTHPYFVATQFHPEFHARPLAPHPLFTAFLAAALTQQS